MSSEEQEFKSGQSYWALVEPVWDEIEIYSGPEEFYRTFAGVSRPAGLLFAAHFCQSEVCNGGFNQFFSNSTGVLAPEAIEEFNAIAQASVAEIIREACSLFGEPFPCERSLRQGKLATIDSALLDALNQRFYATLDKESDGFESAADAYAVKVRGSDPTGI